MQRHSLTCLRWQLVHCLSDDGLQRASTPVILLLNRRIVTGWRLTDGQQTRVILPDCFRVPILLTNRNTNLAGGPPAYLTTHIPSL